MARLTCKCSRRPPPPPCPLRARWPCLWPAQFRRRAAAQRVRDVLLPLVTAVQIGQGGAGSRVPHAVHQLTQVGTLVRRELITGVAQVVKVNRREPGRPSLPPSVSPRPARLAIGRGQRPRATDAGRDPCGRGRPGVTGSQVYRAGSVAETPRVASSQFFRSARWSASAPDPQAQMRRRAPPRHHAASFRGSGAGRPSPREGARTPVAFSEYACRAPHLSLPLPLP